MPSNRRSQCLFGTILVLITPAVGLQAQTAEPEATPSPTPSLEREFFKNILRDQKAIWTAPRHVEHADAKWIVPSAIGFGALVTTDRITGDEMFETDGQVAASEAISHVGSVYGLGAIAASFYLLGRKHNDYRARETGLLAAEALINSMITETALKGISQRARPFAGIERSEFFDGGNSFPSGHSTQTWAVATVIANEYKHRRAVQIAAYGMATAVSVARFTGHKHYLSDVIAGSALGYGIGKFVYNSRHREPGGLSITPQFNRGERRYGVALTWSF